MNDIFVVFFLRHDFKESDSIRLDIVQDPIRYLTLHMVYILDSIHRVIVIDSDVYVPASRIQKSDCRTFESFGQFSLVFNKMIFFVPCASIELLRRPLYSESSE